MRTVMQIVFDELLTSCHGCVFSGLFSYDTIIDGSLPPILILCLSIRGPTTKTGISR